MKWIVIVLQVAGEILRRVWKKKCKEKKPNE